MFENDVEMYGAQTQTIETKSIAKFENDVEMYGAQTSVRSYPVIPGLRMM